MACRACVPACISFLNSTAAVCANQQGERASGSHTLLRCSCARICLSAPSCPTCTQRSAARTARRGAARHGESAGGGLKVCVGGCMQPPQPPRAAAPPGACSIAPARRPSSFRPLRSRTAEAAAPPTPAPLTPRKGERRPAWLGATPQGLFRSDTQTRPSTSAGNSDFVWAPRPAPPRPAPSRTVSHAREPLLAEQRQGELWLPQEQQHSTF